MATKGSGISSTNNDFPSLTYELECVYDFFLVGPVLLLLFVQNAKSSLMGA
jgi:hypothetical protein